MAKYDDTATVSGSVVSIENGADEVGSKSCVVTVRPTLSGVSEVTEKQTGRNLVALNTSPQQPKRDFGITVNTQTTDILNVTTTGVAYACERLFYSFKKGTYAVKFLATSSDSYTPVVSIYRTNGTGVKFNIQPNTLTTFTLADDADLDIRFFASGSGDTTVRTVEFSYFQIEVGSTVSTYSQYNSTVYTASLGRTIYGGEVDIVNGTGTDENGDDFTFDGQEVPTRLGYNAFWSEQGNTELTYYKSGYGFTSVTVHKETPEGEPVVQTVKFHRIVYEGEVDAVRGIGKVSIGESGTEYDPPETFAFEPISISTDEGENTLFANEGDSSITYRKAVD